MCVPWVGCDRQDLSVCFYPVNSLHCFLPTSAVWLEGVTMDFSWLHMYTPPQCVPENTGYTYALRWACSRSAVIPVSAPECQGGPCPVRELLATGNQTLSFERENSCSSSCTLQNCWTSMEMVRWFWKPDILVTQGDSLPVSCFRPHPSGCGLPDKSLWLWVGFCDW